MAKFFLIAMLLSINPYLFNQVFAKPSSGFPEKNTFVTEICNAPAPDSFRITSNGGSFITLSWKPVWEGASHVLFISQRDSSGGWTAQSIFPNVLGSSITVDSLEGGKEYRFRIATKCPSGDPSELMAFVDGIALIVELTLIGRTPKNPQPIDCHGIDYTKHPWLGFRIAGEGYSRLFEVKINGVNEDPYGSVDRVNPENHIVASNMLFLFPDNFNPIIYKVPLTFRIIDITTQTPLPIGLVNINPILTTPNKIDLCNITTDPFNPWKNGYSFTVLFANEVVVVPPGGGIGGQGFGKDPIKDRFTAQNPFNESLNIYTPDWHSNDSPTTIRILNMNGQLIFTQTFEFIDQQVSIPLEWLSPGMYFLDIQSINETEVLKIVKN